VSVFSPKASDMVKPDIPLVVSSSATTGKLVSSNKIEAGLVILSKPLLATIQKQPQEEVDDIQRSIMKDTKMKTKKRNKKQRKRAKDDNSIEISGLGAGDMDQSTVRAAVELLSRFGFNAAS